jgi:hypothetical protein
VPASRRRPSGLNQTCLWPNRASSSGCRLCYRRCRIQLAVTLPDASGAQMALHCDADMVRAIVGARPVKFLSGPAASQGQDAFTEGGCAGFASRRPVSGCSWRPSPASAGGCGFCFSGGSQFSSSGGRCLADARQHALGRLEVGQSSSDRCAFSIEACQLLADLCLLRADLVQYRRCCSRHGDLLWFQVDRNDQSCRRLTPQCRIINYRMHRLTSLAADASAALPKISSAANKLVLLRRRVSEAVGLLAMFGYGQT